MIEIGENLMELLKHIVEGSVFAFIVWLAYKAFKEL